MAAKALQSTNAFCPIFVTDAGIVMDCKLVQPWNVDAAIVARAVAPVSSTDVKVVAFTKFSISVTVGATTTLSMFLLALLAIVPPLIVVPVTVTDVLSVNVTIVSNA